MAIDVSCFTSTEDLRQSVDGLVDHVKSSRVGQGFSEILVPGEPEARERERRLREGIPIDETTWSQIMERADMLNLPIQRLGEN
jgi:uncharacterized oxidoreductase